MGLLDAPGLSKLQADASYDALRRLPPTDLTPIPGALIGHYSYNANPYVQNILTVGEKQYAAWWNAAGAPIIAVRTLGFVGVSAWATFDLSNVPGNPLAAPVIPDGHNVLAIGMDSTGCLHLLANMHDSPMRYARQTVAGDITKWVAATMTGANEDSVTYPFFLMLPDGTLDLLYRSGIAGNGDYWRNRYNTTTKVWTQTAKLFDGQTSNESAYLNTPVVHPNGDVSFFFLWRAGGLANTNADLCYVRVKADGTAAKGNGSAQTLPVTHANSEKVYPTAASGSGLVNQQGASVDAAGAVHSSQWIYDANGKTQFLHTYRDLLANAWVSETVTAFDVRVDLAVEVLGPNMSRTICVSDSTGRTWIVGRVNYNGLSGSLIAVEVTPGKAHTVTALANLDLYDFEPAVDIVGMRTRSELHMLLAPAKANGPTSDSYGDATQWAAQWGAVLSIQLRQLPAVGAAPQMKRLTHSSVVAATNNTVAQAALSAAPTVLVEADWPAKHTLVRFRGVAGLSATGAGAVALIATPPGGAATTVALVPVTATAPTAVSSAWMLVPNVAEGSVLSLQAYSGNTGTTLTVTGTVEVAQIYLADNRSLPRLVDTQAPSVPATPTAASGPASATLNTTGSTDNVAVTGYYWYRNGGSTPIATTSAPTYLDTGLTAGTTYTYKVAAFDAAGNVSAQSASVAVVPTAAASIVDDFSGGDAATLAGRLTPTGAVAWSQMSGTGLNGVVGIKSGAAAATSTSINPGFMVVATGTYKMKVQATMTAYSAISTAKWWLLANAQDTNNYYAIRLNGTVGYVFVKQVAGVTTTLSSYSGVPPAAGDVVSITTTDTTVTFTINGTVRYSTAIDSTLAPFTKAGVGFQYGADTVSRLDNFSVTPQ